MADARQQHRAATPSFTNPTVRARTVEKARRAPPSSIVTGISDDLPSATGGPRRAAAASAAATARVAGPTESASTLAARGGHRKRASSKRSIAGISGIAGGHLDTVDEVEAAGGDDTSTGSAARQSMIDGPGGARVPTSWVVFGAIGVIVLIVAIVGIGFVAFDAKRRAQDVILGGGGGGGSNSSDGIAGHLDSMDEMLRATAKRTDSVAQATASSVNSIVQRIKKMEEDLQAVSLSERVRRGVDAASASAATADVKPRLSTVREAAAAEEEEAEVSPDSVAVAVSAAPGTILAQVAPAATAGDAGDVDGGEGGDAQHVSIDVALDAADDVLRDFAGRRRTSPPPPRAVALATPSGESVEVQEIKLAQRHAP